MVFTGTLPRLAVVVLAVTLTLTGGAHSCLAASQQPTNDEPFTPTDHLIGDTLARGIECLLNPVYRGVSGLYFWIAEPPIPEHVTTVRIVEPAPQPQEPVDQQTEYDSP